MDITKMFNTTINILLLIFLVLAFTGVVDVAMAKPHENLPPEEYIRQQNADLADSVLRQFILEYDPLLVLVIMGNGFTVTIYLIITFVLYFASFLKGTHHDFRMPFFNGKHVFIDIRNYLKDIKEQMIEFNASISSMHKRLDAVKDEIKEQKNG